jgi:2-aminoadipate transaminase
MRPPLNDPLGAAARPDLDWPALLAGRSARAGDKLTAILSLAASTDVITFSGGFPAPETFPAPLLQELLPRVLGEGTGTALQYSPTEGLPRARQAVARLVADTQGRPVDPADVLITSGGIEGLQLLTRMLVDPGDRVLVEAPSYLGAIMAFAGFEAEVEGVPIDTDGLRVDDLEAALARGRPPKLLYVIPDHQNPTGVSLAEERRRPVVELCRRHGVPVIEDVAYRELGFDGSARTSLWSLAPDLVVQLGTFSKILAPGFRLGWAVGPAPLLAAMTAAKQNSDQCAGAFGQTVMAEYVLGGHLAGGLAAARGLYRRRAGLMLDALAAHMPEGVSWTRPAGGFFVWLTAGEHVDTRDLVDPAARLGVAFVPGAPFYPGPEGANRIRLSYSRVADSAIDDGVQRLAALLRAPGAERP